MKDKCCSFQARAGRWWINLFVWVNLPRIRRTVLFEVELGGGVNILNLGFAVCLRWTNGDICLSLPFVDLLVGYHRSYEA